MEPATAGSSGCRDREMRDPGEDLGTRAGPKDRPFGIIAVGYKTGSQFPGIETVAKGAGLCLESPSNH